MRRLNFKKVVLWVPLLLFFFVAFTQAHTVTVPSTCHFGYGNGCYVNFSTQKAFDSVYRSSGYWYFNGYGFRVSSANLTVTDYFVSDSDKLYYTVTASSGTSTTKIYCGDKGQPEKVYGATSDSYDPATNVATITVDHASAVPIIVDWTETSPPSGGEEEEEGGGAEVHYKLSVTVVDEQNDTVTNVDVSVLRNLVSIDSKITDFKGECQFVLVPDTYLVVAEYGPKLGTAEVKLDRDKPVTLTLGERPLGWDLLETVREVVIEPLEDLVPSYIRALLFNFGAFAFLCVGALVGGYGWSLDEDWLKVIGVLIVVLGLLLFAYVYLLT